jgi:hypothetical protein
VKLKNIKNNTDFSLAVNTGRREEGKNRGFLKDILAFF